MANSALRIIVVVALALLIGLAPMGVGQVPGGGGGGSFYLSDAEDVHALAVVLASLSSQGEIPRLDSIQFRLALLTSSQKLYKGRLRVAPATTRGGGTERDLGLYFVHRRGTPCAIPPDQLYLLPAAVTPVGTATAPPRPVEIEFLIALLYQLSAPAISTPLVSLARWFEGTPDLVLEGIAVSSSGTKFKAALRFVDRSASTPVVHDRCVVADRVRADFTGWSVQ